MRKPEDPVNLSSYQLKQIREIFFSLDGLAHHLDSEIRSIVKPTADLFGDVMEQIDELMNPHDS
jgi:hypothetical protein